MAVSKRLRWSSAVGSGDCGTADVRVQLSHASDDATRPARRRLLRRPRRHARDVHLPASQRPRLSRPHDRHARRHPPCRPRRRRAPGSSVREQPGLSLDVVARGRQHDRPGRSRARRTASARRPTAYAAGRAREEPLIRSVVDELLDAVADRGEMEVVDALAAQYPSKLTCELLGFPADRWRDLKSWSERMMRIDSSSRDGSGQVLQDLMAAIMEFQAFLDEAVPKFRVEPDRSFISVWANATVKGCPMHDHTIMNETGLFISGGAETTRTAIARGLRGFCDHPDQWERLAADPSLVPSAVEEVLRWVSPLNQMFRTAVADDHIGDTAVRAGDRIALLYPSANRDEAVFEDPFRFDITRNPNPHIAFGFGPHVCIGQSLARPRAAGAVRRRWPGGSRTCGWSASRSSSGTSSPAPCSGSISLSISAEEARTMTFATNGDVQVFYEMLRRCGRPDAGARERARQPVHQLPRRMVRALCRQGLSSRADGQPRRRAVDALLRRSAERGGVHALRHGERRDRSARRARRGPRARHGALDGRDDRADARDRTSGPPAVGDVRDVDDRRTGRGPIDARRRRLDSSGRPRPTDPRRSRTTSRVSGYGGARARSTRSPKRSTRARRSTVPSTRPGWPVRSWR